MNLYDIRFRRSVNLYLFCIHTDLIFQNHARLQRKTHTYTKNNWHDTNMLTFLKTLHDEFDNGNVRLTMQHI